MVLRTPSGVIAAYYSGPREAVQPIEQTRNDRLKGLRSA